MSGSFRQGRLDDGKPKNFKYNLSTTVFLLKLGVDTRELIIFSCG